VKAFANPLPGGPLGLFTVTVTAPAALAGVLQVREFPLAATATLVAAALPNVTVTTPLVAKPDPLTVTGVPPEVGPVFGFTDVTLGPAAQAAPPKRSNAERKLTRSLRIMASSWIGTLRCVLFCLFWAYAKFCNYLTSIDL
jgi:hypothetical protein